MRISLMVAMIFFGVNLNSNAAQKICIVNFDEAIAKEEEAKDSISSLEDDFQKLMKEKEKVSQDFQKEVEKYKAAQGKLSEKARQQKEQELGTKMNMLQNQFAQKEQALKERERNITQELQNKNQYLVKSIGKKKGCSLVLNSQAAVYVDPAILKTNDLTSELVTQYNKAYPVKKKTNKNSKK